MESNISRDSSLFSHQKIPRSQLLPSLLLFQHYPEILFIKLRVSLFFQFFLTSKVYTHTCLALYFLRAICADQMILYTDNPKQSTKKLLELIYSVSLLDLKSICKTNSICNNQKLKQKFNSIYNSALPHTLLKNKLNTRSIRLILRTL